MKSVVKKYERMFLKGANQLIECAKKTGSVRLDMDTFLFTKEEIIKEQEAWSSCQDLDFTGSLFWLHSGSEEPIGLDTAQELFDLL